MEKQIIFILFATSLVSALAQTTGDSSRNFRTVLTDATSNTQSNLGTLGDTLRSSTFSDSSLTPGLGLQSSSSIIDSNPFSSGRQDMSSMMRGRGFSSDPYIRQNDRSSRSGSGRFSGQDFTSMSQGSLYTGQGSDQFPYLDGQSMYDENNFMGGPRSGRGFRRSNFRGRGRRFRNFGRNNLDTSSYQDMFPGSETMGMQGRRNMRMSGRGTMGTGRRGIMGMDGRETMRMSGRGRMGMRDQISSSGQSWTSQ